MQKNKKITISLASMPSRVNALERTIESLIKQTDTINIYLNGFNKIPDFIKQKKINYYMSQNYKDLGDIGKFYWAHQINGYHFTCDDDIIYPKNYIENTIKKLEKYKGFVSYHGAILIEPIKSYYDCRKVYHFEKKVLKDQKVHVLGTGVMAYDADEIKLHHRMFKQKNMTDLYIAIFAKKQKISCTEFLMMLIT